MQRFQLIVRFVVAEQRFVHCFKQQPRRNCIKVWIVFNVLQRRLDYRFIQLLCRHAVKKRQPQFARNLHNFRDLVRQTLARLHECEIDLVRVKRLFTAVALNDCNIAHIPPFIIDAY